MIRFIMKNPGITLLIVLCVACVIVGPASVGAWLGSTARMCVISVWDFSAALIESAF